MKLRDNRSINIKGIKRAQQQFVGKHESLTCYLHMQGMLNNNTTSYTLYARAVTINYPYMTIFTFHNLGGERFILFTNQIISLCTSKHFFLSVYLCWFFFWLSVLALLAFAQLNNFIFQLNLLHFTSFTIILQLIEQESGHQMRRALSLCL